MVNMIIFAHCFLFVVMQAEEHEGGVVDSQGRKLHDEEKQTLPPGQGPSLSTEEEQHQHQQHEEHQQQQHEERRLTDRGNIDDYSNLFTFLAIFIGANWLAGAVERRKVNSTPFRTNLNPTMLFSPGAAGRRRRP